MPSTAASLVTAANANPYSYVFDTQKLDRLSGGGAARAHQSLQDLSQVFNGFQSYAPLSAASGPGAGGAGAANAAANGALARGFNVAAAQAVAAQQAALEAAALYASVGGGEPFPAMYPPLHHQTAQLPHAFHKV
ncbi:unnamed protein product [Anisakis simplex]|uniref:Uncharacterized protein n=2 Tax=Anisakis simplex TaxID=6269 RepID=A0A3P6S207_ANISI|nr:unnamed protein product [Anisakis simplex]